MSTHEKDELEVCADCDGTGEWIGREGPQPCEVCDGTGLAHRGDNKFLLSHIMPARTRFGR